MDVSHAAVGAPRAAAGRGVRAVVRGWGLRRVPAHLGLGGVSLVCIWRVGHTLGYEVGVRRVLVLVHGVVALLYVRVVA